MKPGRFITVTTNFVWDFHADKNNAGCEEGSRYTSLPLDHALSTLITDLHERGLSDKVLVVVTGEMGRTPRINKNGGRDHWGNITPLLLSGGGLRMVKSLVNRAATAANRAPNRSGPSIFTEQ